MSKPTPYTEWYRQVKWLPAIDWNVKFFGGHEQRVPYGWNVPREAHIGFELNLVLRGMQETDLEGSRFVLNAGDMLLIPPGFRHSSRCVSQEGMHYFTAHFNVDDPDFRHLMVRYERMLFRAGTEENGLLRSIADRWLELLRRDDGYSTEDRFRIQMQLFELFGALAHMTARQRTEQRDPQVSPSSAHYAKAIAEAIKARFDPHAPQEELAGDRRQRIEDIAASLGIAPGYALEVFRKIYGMSPRQYLSDLKLHEAKVLIQQSGLAFKDIAARLGYAHLSHFSRQFKRWTGMSPLQYRQKSGDSGLT